MPNLRITGPKLSVEFTPKRTHFLLRGDQHHAPELVKVDDRLQAMDCASTVISALSEALKQPDSFGGNLDKPVSSIRLLSKPHARPANKNN